VKKVLVFPVVPDPLSKPVETEVHAAVLDVLEALIGALNDVGGNLKMEDIMLVQPDKSTMASQRTLCAALRRPAVVSRNMTPAQLAAALAPNQTTAHS
jgi:hypothetical protein